MDAAGRRRVRRPRICRSSSRVAQRAVDRRSGDSHACDRGPDLSRSSKGCCSTASGGSAGRKHDPDGRAAPGLRQQPIEVAWTAAPTMIVFFLVLVTARTLWEVEAERRRARGGRQRAVRHRDRPSVVVGVRRTTRTTAGSWASSRPTSCTFRRATTETSRPTYLTLKSADVCHSFWVPRLGGKIDLIPGRTNSLGAARPTEPGLYLGQCAEYCGTQHANMLLRVVVASAGRVRGLAGERGAAGRRRSGGPRGQGGVSRRVVRQLPSQSAARRRAAPTRRI